MANVRNMGSVATLGTKTITENGTYNASDDNVDGYSQVSVVVPPAVLGNKSITSNGIYTASSDNLDGYSQVVVDVSGGTTATITVSYSSQFYNKTMTCSKGSTTYTETTTSSGVTVFNVDSSGTWTIACDGISRTVDVVLEYTTQMAITQTVTVYSAASDTVSFTDATGAKTVTTNANGQGSVSITFIPPSANITFTSSIAKNPNNLSQAYSKTITMTDSITTIKVMPDGAIYWWGYIGMSLSIINNSGVSISYMTNKMLFTANSGTMYKAGNLITDNLIALISSRIKLVSGGGQGIYAGSISFGLSDLTATTTIFSGSAYASLPDNTLYSCDVSASDKKISVNLKDGGATGSNTYIYIKALWYE